MGRISVNKSNRAKFRTEFYERIDKGGITPRDAVKALRKISGLTQEQFASTVNISPLTLKSIERGAANPTQATLERILSIGDLVLTVGRRRTEGS
ncbi:MAG: XRE family transcriptional regulator [Proteobacteria bacterium]|nr:XRE family transcriptional regulator [Pseudomonadota bacterium]